MATSVTEVFNAVATTTLRNYNPEMQAQIYDAIPVFKHMRENGRVKTLSGGREIAVDLVYKENSTFQWYSGAEPADTSEQDEFTRALYPWALAREAIMINDQDLDMNAGNKERLHDLLQERIENAEQSMMQNMSRAFHGTRGSVKEMLGLGDYIPSTTRNDTIIGRINPTLESWWDVKRIASGVTGTNLKQSIRDLYNQTTIRVPANKRDGLVGITTRDIFEEYEDQLEDVARFDLMQQNNSKSLGFGLADTLTYKGKPIIWDEDAATDTFKWVNTNYLRLHVHKNRNFTSDPMRTPVDAHFSVSYIRFMGNLVGNFQAAQGGLFSVSV